MAAGKINDHISPVSLNGHTKRPDPVGWPPAPRDGRGRKVLFINPPSIPYNALLKIFAKDRSLLQQTVSMPMGILYLAATLERDLPGIGISIVDIAKGLRELVDEPGKIHSFLEDFLEDQLGGEDGAPPDLIGISVLFSTAHKTALLIAQACKKKWPNVPVVVGGMHATNAVPDLLKCPHIDFVCRGEAEAIIASLVLQPGEHIPGIIGRNNPHRGDSAPLVYDLDSIPYPAWHLIPMAEYTGGGNSRAQFIAGIEQDREATIVTTRGCPFHCTFCASWTVHGREMRYRSTANILGELKHLNRHYGITAFIPEDDLFTVKKSRFLDLCAAIDAEFKGSLHFQFPNGLSVATLDEEVLAAMVKMGMKIANIAVESGSELVQKQVIKKNVNLDRARKVVQACHDLGIITRVYFILGFPGETREQMQETIDFACSLPADWCLFSVAAPLIGTEMYAQRLARGEIDETFNWDNAFFQERTFDTPEISAQEIKDLAYGANLRVNFFENFNLRSGNHSRAIELYQSILYRHKGHLAAQWCLGEALKRGGRKEEAEAAFQAARKLVEAKDALAMDHLTRFPQYFPWAKTIPADAEMAA